jgi:hypothetical protein
VSGCEPPAGAPRLLHQPAAQGGRLLICTGAVEQLASERAFLKQHGIGVLAKRFDLDDLLAHIPLSQVQRTAI